MKVGEVYASPRGRLYTVLRFEDDGVNDVVLWNQTFKQEEKAISELMTEDNGWRLQPKPG